MRTILVGDVHGCVAELKRLLDKVEFEVGRDRLLLTGDAFSRGPDPLAVWKVISSAGAEMVLGNHDARLLDFLRLLADGQAPDFRKPDQKRTVAELAPVGEQLLEWLETVPLMIEEDEFLLVHAGINPQRGLAGTTTDEFLAIRLWPPGPGVSGPRWHSVIEPQDRAVVFGHDAPGGLVLEYREGESAAARSLPYLIGLDSGCVYGGQLSAYLLEERRLVQVEAERVWFGGG